jgi:hypothetical protein
LNANSRLTGGVASRRAFPAGTQLMFVNAAAPVGWVRVSSVDDALMRIVGSAVPGSGGSNGFVATVNGQTGTGTGTTGTGTSGATTISTATMPAHTHTGAASATIGCGGSPLYEGTAGCRVTGVGTNTGSNGSGGSHTHTIPGLSVPSLSVTFGIKYVDAIIAKKS